MTNSELEQLRFPIGLFTCPKPITPDHIDGWIRDIASFPRRVAEVVEPLDREQIEWRYRPGGWNIRQVVRHCADSHLNSIIRFKWTLTEDTPLIKAYFEDRWAELPDYEEANLSQPLALLKALHQNWVSLLQRLSGEQLNRCFKHPENGRTISLKENIGIYAWHGNHHLAHIKQALEAKGQYG